MATWDYTVDVNVFSESQSVDITNFGRPCLATEDVDVGFTEAYRVYTSNSAVQADTDLLAGAKADAAQFFSQDLRPRDLMIANVTYTTLNTDLDALLVETTDFYGVCCADRTKATQILLAAWVLANSRIGAIQSLDPDILAGTAGNLFETISNLSNGRAFGIWHDDNAEAVDLAWMATILATNMDTQSSVAHHKELVGMSVVPTTTMNDTEQAQVVAYEGNVYLPYKGANVMMLGTMFDGGAIEDKILDDWFEARLGEGFARLAVQRSNALSKIPYDDDGIADCEGVIRAVAEKGAAINHFVDGTLTLDVPKLADIDAATRASKKVTIAGNIQRAGSIRDFEFNVAVTF